MNSRCLPFAIKLLALAVLALTMTVPAWTQTETILYSFTGGSDGGSPESGLVLDSKGNLYGTSQSGGANFYGAAVELTQNANGVWTEQVLHSFTGFGPGGDGDSPWGGLTFDSKGNLYGTTQGGGPGSRHRAKALTASSDSAAMSPCPLDILAPKGHVVGAAPLVPIPFLLAAMGSIDRTKGWL